MFPVPSFHFLPKNKTKPLFIIYILFLCLGVFLLLSQNIVPSQFPMKMEFMLYLYRKFKRLKKWFNKNEIEILCLTENVLILNKPHDLKINSNNKNEVTVQTLLKKLYPSLANEKLCHEFYFPQRLDYATSGVMCIPLDKQECHIISKAFSERKVEKYYIALVRGLFSKEAVDINVPIGEDIQERNIFKMCSAYSEFCDKARNARSLFLVLEEGIFKNYPSTKILIKLFTGRRHQIRVHCSFLGHTIIGDFTYSNRKDTQPDRMFLHSIRLIVPTSKKLMDIETEDPFRNIKDWKTVKTVNDIRNGEAYDKMQSYVSELNL